MAQVKSLGQGLNFLGIPSKTCSSRRDPGRTLLTVQFMQINITGRAGKRPVGGFGGADERYLVFKVPSINSQLGQSQTSSSGLLSGYNILTVLSSTQSLEERTYFPQDHFLWGCNIRNWFLLNYLLLRLTIESKATFPLFELLYLFQFIQFQHYLERTSFLVCGWQLLTSTRCLVL